MPMKAAARPVILLMALVVMGACRSAPAPPARPAPVPPTVAVAPPAAAAGLPDSVRWVRDAAEYRALALQTYRAAALQVEEAARGRQPGTWAVVLDADETVISNLSYQIEIEQRGEVFAPESWNAWVRRREAVPMPGAGAFLARVRGLGGRIAIVTNRLESECADTEAVFRAHGLAYDVLLCRRDDGPSDKNPRFLAVAEGTTAAGGPALEIVAFVGDNIQDFPDLTQARVRQDPSALGRFGVTYFMLPNPMYGSWQ